MSSLNSPKHDVPFIMVCLVVFLGVVMLTVWLLV
jgi:hypothetical protein